ncbi:uncharacterized protein LOC112568232 [Pomacea canaliculata]|uniref:uncharacterized protein LOC112568232 n=1 Tax=Pomacea canaliculata TaxID=400727 RepID=UPI000D73C07B|nr:uncharacterized protein LOC112568232 [Pomacea canaliculata]
MSINITMFVITSLFLLVILKDCSGHKIEGCSPQSPMGMNATTNTFKCVDIPPGHRVLWYVRKKYPNDEHIVIVAKVAECTMERKGCKKYLNNVKAFKKTATSSVAKIFSQDMSAFLSIGCMVFTERSLMMDYACDLISNVQSFTCSLTQEPDHSMSAVCTILKIYILSRDYKCKFILTLQDGTVQTITDTSFMRTEQTEGPATGTCYGHNLPRKEHIKQVEGIFLPDDLHAIANFQD